MVDLATLKEDDELVLHSKNGHDYRVVIANINRFRPPEEIYAVDVYDENGTHHSPNGDVAFVGEDFIKLCSYPDKN